MFRHILLCSQKLSVLELSTLLKLTANSNNNIQWSYQSCNKVLMAHNPLDSNVPQSACHTKQTLSSTYVRPPLLKYNTKFLASDVYSAWSSKRFVSQNSMQFISHTKLAPRLVPRPRPAFCHLQYGKLVRAWYLFSREHDVIGKWWKCVELTSCVLCISTDHDYTLNAWCVQQSPP